MSSKKELEQYTETTTVTRSTQDAVRKKKGALRTGKSRNHVSVGKLDLIQRNTDCVNILLQSTLSLAGGKKWLNQESKGDPKKARQLLEDLIASNDQFSECSKTIVPMTHQVTTF